MIIGDMTAVKYELNRNCLSQSITNSGLQDVVRRTSNITTSFAQDKNKIRIRLTLALWQWHIYRCLLFWLFIYLFIYLFVRSFVIECCTEGELVIQWAKKSESLGDKFS